MPGSIAASTGRPAARIEYVFDGTLTRPRPALQRDEVDVAGRQHLGQPIDRLVAGEADVGQTARAGPASARRAAPSPLITNISDGHRSRGLDDHFQRLREADVAGVQHDGLVADAELAAQFGHAIAAAG